MGIRIRNKLNALQTGRVRRRFNDLIYKLGGPRIVSLDTDFSYGYLRAILGSSKRVPSPKLISSLLSQYKDEIDSKFTREYLRPDLTPSQWRAIEDSTNSPEKA